jgi:hypothetical protein
MLSILRTLVVGALAFLAIAAATMYVVSWIYPPRTPDGHPVMPIAQVLFGGISGGLAAVAAMIGDRIWQRRQRARKPF